MKRVIFLLRVSTDAQLDKDGDMKVQRALLQEEMTKHPDWKFCGEYVEAGVSAYKNSISQRVALQEILQRAKKKEFDILLVFKDDRISRLMNEAPLYIMELKNYGVEVYSIVDGCISTEWNDFMGRLMLEFRYLVAEKSSYDTGIRVKNTAKELVKTGKFMGGRAPYGYTLEYSGEYSKHERALKHLVIDKVRSEVVKEIYRLSIEKEYGFVKIAKMLNSDEKYRKLASNDVWKAETIKSILTNPIYAGFTAYNRREHVEGKEKKYRRLDSKDWIIANEQNLDITIIDPNMWNTVQKLIALRREKYTKKLEHKDVTVIARNDGKLALIDVLHCGYCGRKMTNGSKYNYWTIKGTGEKRSSQIPVYKCQNVWQGVPHDKYKQIRADKIEPIIFEALAEYIEKLQENEDIFEQITANQNVEKKKKEEELKKLKKNLEKIQQHLHIMKGNIPDAMTGDYPLSLNELVECMNEEKAKEAEQLEEIRGKEDEIAGLAVSAKEWNNIQNKIPTWRDIFLNADTASKRVLVDKIVERIDLWRDKAKIRFKFNLNSFLDQSRMSIDIGVSEQGV